MFDLTERVTRRNQNLESELPLTISAQNGLIDQNDFFDKRIASKNLENYYLLYKGEFAYNKSTSNEAPWGAIKRLDKYDKGVVSSLYIAFGIRFGRIDSNFLVSYFDTSFWFKEIKGIASEGARNHGLLNVAPKSFFDIQISIPKTLKEQWKIGFIFGSLESTIVLHQRKLEHLSSLKKALLQKMFPVEGEDKPLIRFSNFTDAWEQRKFCDCATIQRGGSPRPIDNYITHDPGGVNWIKIGDVSTDAKYIYKTEDRIIPEGAAKSRWVYPGDLILSNSMSFGRPYICKISGCIHDGWLLIRDEKSLFDKEFLVQLLSSDSMLSQYKALAAGSTVNNLNKDLVSSTTVCYPKKEEQRVIGAFLGIVDSSIVLHQRKLEELQKLKKSLLQKMFI